MEKTRALEIAITREEHRVLSDFYNLVCEIWEDYITKSYYTNDDELFEFLEDIVNTGYFYNKDDFNFYLTVKENEREVIKNEN